VTLLIAIIPAWLFDRCLCLTGDQGAYRLIAALPPDSVREFPIPAAAFDQVQADPLPDKAETCIFCSA
jgi:hypothetical protein